MDAYFDIYDMGACDWTPVIMDQRTSEDGQYSLKSIQKGTRTSSLPRKLDGNKVAS